MSIVAEILFVVLNVLYPFDKRVEKRLWSNDPSVKGNIHNRLMKHSQMWSPDDRGYDLAIKISAVTFPLRLKFNRYFASGEL